MIVVTQASKEEIQKASDEAYARKLILDRVLDMTLSMAVFLRDVVGVLSQRYGIGIQMKIAFDSMGYLTKAKKFYGDLEMFSTKLGKDIHFEIKSSYSNESNGGYRITHTRSYEHFDYFLLCLVDQDDGFQERFYLIPKKYITDNPKEFRVTPMNGDSEQNMENKFVEMSKTVSKDFANSYFGKYNVLNGTDYNDWIDFLNSHISEDDNKFDIKKYRFYLNGMEIQKDSNPETILTLANYIGGITAMKIFPPNKIKHGCKNSNHTIRLNTGWYHIDPNFTVDDIRYMLMKAKRLELIDLKFL